MDPNENNKLTKKSYQVVLNPRIANRKMKMYSLMPKQSSAYMLSRQQPSSFIDIDSQMFEKDQWEAVQLQLNKPLDTKGPSAISSFCSFTMPYPSIFTFN